MLFSDDPSYPALHDPMSGAVLLDAAKADVWSLAVTLLSCRLGVHPWASTSTSEPCFKVRGNVDGEPTTCPMAFLVAVEFTLLHGDSDDNTDDMCAAHTCSTLLVALFTTVTGVRRASNKKIKVHCRLHHDFPQAWASAWEEVRREGHAGASTLPGPRAVALGRALVTWCGCSAEAVATQWSPDLLDLLARMLDPSPATRPDMEEVLRHPWLAGPGPAGADHGADDGDIEDEADDGGDDRDGLGSVVSDSGDYDFEGDACGSPMAVSASGARLGLGADYTGSHRVCVPALCA